MNWFYVSGGQQAGPVTESQLDELFRTGVVNADTLVWREGMPNWAPYRQARPAAAPPPATPPSILTPQTATAFGPGVSESDLLAADYEVRIGYCIERGWELFRSDSGLIIGASALVFLALMAANGIPYLSILLSLFLTGPLMAGLWTFNLKHVRGQPATVGDAFSGFSPRFWQYFLVYLIPALIVMAFVFVMLVMLVVSFGGIGMLIHAHRPPDISLPLALALSGVGLVGVVVITYVKTCWFFALPLVADKNLDFWSALQLSRAMVMKHWWMTFLLLFVVNLIGICGFFLCCVGLIVTVPLAFLILAVHYENVFGRLSPRP